MRRRNGVTPSIAEERLRIGGVTPSMRRSYSVNDEEEEELLRQCGGGGGVTPSMQLVGGGVTPSCGGVTSVDAGGGGFLGVTPSMRRRRKEEELLRQCGKEARSYSVNAEELEELLRLSIGRGVTPSMRRITRSYSVNAEEEEDGQHSFGS